MSTIARLAAQVRSGQVSARRVAAAALDAVSAQNPQYNAATRVLAARALAQADAVDAMVQAGRDPGPLAGVPYGVKDLFDVEGLPTTAGAAMRLNAPPASGDAEAVRLLNDAGAVLIATLNMDEFAYGFATVNAHYGVTRNPRDPVRLAGGSSGGSAAAVAAGMLAFAMGSDTNGSIRVPAGLTGIYGLKPTHGALPMSGVYPFVDSFDDIGPLAASIADLNAVWSVLAGAPAAGPTAEPRIARLGGYFRANTDPDLLTGIDAIADALGGAPVVELEGAEIARSAAFVMTAAEGGAFHLPALRDNAMGFDPATRDRLLAGALTPASSYLRAQAFRLRFSETAQALFSRFDVLIAPSAPCIAPLIDNPVMIVDGHPAPARANLGMMTQPLSFIGLPVIAAPLPRAQALPLGVQLVAAPGAEATLFALAGRLEREGLIGAAAPVHDWIGGVAGAPSLMELSQGPEMDAAPEINAIPPAEGAASRLDRLFSLKERGTTVRTEVLAGVTTFLTMAYIVLVNPSILGLAGMPVAAVAAATCLAAAFASIMMGFVANIPLALAPGMGLNAYFSFTVVQQMGVPWETALGCVFVSGVVFLALTLAGVRQMIVSAIPMNIFSAVAGGIGLFISFIGLKNAGIIVANPATFVSLGDLRAPGPGLALFGLVLIAALMAWKVRAAMLIGILVTTLAAAVMGQVKFEAQPYALTALTETAFKMDLASVFGLNGAPGLGILEIIFVFLFVDMFDNIGTLVGVTKRAGLISPDGKIEKLNRILTTDSVATMVGAAAGTSTVTSYVESAAGVQAGGRTGLTAIVTGVLFLAVMFVAPYAQLVPVAATAPALILVGALMMAPLVEVKWDEPDLAIPAFMTLIMIPLTFSIANGLAFGITAHAALKIIRRKASRADWLLFLLAGLFVARFFWMSAG